MSDDGGEESRLPARTTIIYLAVCFLIGASGVAVAAHLANSSPAEGTTAIGTDNLGEGLMVFVEGNKQIDLSDPQGSLGNTVNIITESGNATVYSPGVANATVHKDDLEGTWTNVTDLDADQNLIEVDPGDKAQATVGGEINTFAWRAGIAEDDGTADFSYGGGTGNSRVTVQGVTGSTRMAAVDSSSGVILDEATSTSGGDITFDELDGGIHDVRIESFDPAAPTLSNPSPTGGTSSPPTTVEVDVSDANFPEGDSVDVTIDVDGSTVSTQTITSNQTVTASVPASGQTGGSHSWSVTATDDFGETASDSYSYSVPTKLFIRNEETGNLIDNQQVNMTVYTRDETPEILNFTTSNGEVDLSSGFPSSEPFVVVAESDGYLDRRIFVQNVYQTQDLYLLNESLQHTDVIFQIEDYTGRFPPDETVLEVQRGIGGNWTTVLGDYFGANDQFTAQIRYNTRHRLVLVNAQTGERRVLGTYTPLTSAQETITVSPEGDLDLPDEFPTVSFEPTTRTLPQENGVDVTGDISSGTMDLQSYEMNVYHIDGAQNTTLASATGSSDDGESFTETIALANREGKVKVVMGYTLSDGTQGSQVATYSINAGASRSMTLLQAIAGLVGLVPGQNQDAVMTLTAMVLTIVSVAAVGRAFRLSAEGMGLVTLIPVTGFSILGWLPYSLMFTVLAVFGSLTFLRRRY